jgi:galactose mutarotase-like enzyme
MKNMKTKKIKMKIQFLIAVVILHFASVNAAEKTAAARWTKEKATSWYTTQPWFAGSNFQPSSAINQMEMWAADTYDAATIDKELGWAEELGFNLMRVYLSSEVWKTDPAGLKKRMDSYLSIADKHGIKTLFVIFDDCWNEETLAGKQPAPKPGVHNSGWIQDPACSLRADTTKLFPVLEKYVKDIIGSFKNDKRILLWDLYNEPGNSGHGLGSLPLLRNVFRWARELNPSQPVSACIWNFDNMALNTFALENSDVITYHNYNDVPDHSLWINFLKAYSRPIICTEYMARRNNSRFQNIMPILKRNNIGAINWGFVSGKTNTIFAWDEPRPNEKEPPLWFHDIYRQDKTPFDPAEVEFIKQMTGKNITIKLIPAANFDTIIIGKKVALFTLKNRQGTTTQITNFGGRVVNLWVADKDNSFRDIVTGHNTIAKYLTSPEVYFGALIGRYGNRIANGKFTLNGKSYQLPVNNGVNHLHGGSQGFHNVVWSARQFKNLAGEDALELKYLSPDGEQGYPGNLNTTVVYTLTNANELKLEYVATTDKPTVVNLTHHSFFNLHGFNAGISKSINSHLVVFNAKQYTPTDKGLIPTGEIATVENTPMDFRKPQTIGARVDHDFEALKNGLGYDHNWILNKMGDKVSEAAHVFEPESGIHMRVFTDQPAIQFYGGNFFNATETGKYGEVYTHRSSFALEAQNYPDAPNHPNFPSAILKPGETYRQTTIYAFEIKK